MTSERAWPSRALTNRWLPAAEVAIGLALVAAYFVIRTLGLPEIALTAWLVVAVAFTVGSPLCGLAVLTAIGPFTEALTDDGRITALPYLLAALGAGVAIRIVITRPLPRPNWPIVLAILLMAGTALGVLYSYLTYGAERGRLAAEMWVPGIGGAMTVLIAAAYVSWRGRVEPLFIAIASATTAAVLALINFAGDGYLRTSTAVGWLLRQEDAGGRLTGVIPAANPAGVIFMLGLVGLVALGLLGARRWFYRLLTLPVAAVVLFAIWETGSRSTLLGAAVALGLLLFAWNWRAGIAAGLVLLGAMAYLIASGGVRDVPVVSDQARLDAWVATVRLWADHPFIGAGFRSFEWLHSNAGSPLINAPHNEWLRFFGEEGTVIGLIGLALAVLAPIVALRARNWISVTAGAVAAGVFVAACFNNPFIYTQVNVAAFAIIGTGLGLATVPMAARGSPPVPPAEVHEQP